MGQNPEICSKELLPGLWPHPLLSLGMLGWDLETHISASPVGSLGDSRNLLLAPSLVVLLALVSQGHPSVAVPFRTAAEAGLLSYSSLLTPHEHPPSPAAWHPRPGLILD